MRVLNTSTCHVTHEPFKYVLVQNFADTQLLIEIDKKYLSQMPKALYVTESVPHLFMKEIDPSTFVEGGTLSIPCVSDFTESNKSHKGAELKEITLNVEPSGQQGINRTFVDINNVDQFPLVKELTQALVTPEITDFLTKTFDVDLKGTALRVELLRNGPGHFLTPHCDCVEKIISLLIFVNENGQPLNAGTDIYREIGGEGTTSATLERSFDHFEKVEEIPFVTGNALIFHPGMDTWHGLDKMKTFDDRRLIQINWVSPEYSNHPECLPVD